ncbi:MAG: protein SCO1/2 [Lysobacterales bacterium]|jgi:protein SCO1/2
MAAGLIDQGSLMPGARNGCPVLLFFIICLWAVNSHAQLMENAEGWDQDSAINHSQAVIGKRIGDYQFTSRDGTFVSLSEYTGKPLLISMVFTSCHHVCPLTTRRLNDAVQAARDVMEPGSFNVLTIGFDSVNDTPQAMRTFALAQKISDDNWDFLSADFETVNALATELGFIFYRSPRGFDHITQVSVVDRAGVVYRQVYGVQFELPWLVEPLKQLVFNRPEHTGNPIAGLLGKIRLFCTVYDPASDRYHFDYSLFIQMAIGLAAIIGLSLFLIRGLRRPGPG